MKHPFTFSFHWPWIKNAFSDKDKRYSTAHVLYIYVYLKPIEFRNDGVFEWLGTNEKSKVYKFIQWFCRYTFPIGGE